MYGIKVVTQSYMVFGSQDNYPCEAKQPFSGAKGTGELSCAGQEGKGSEGLQMSLRHLRRLQLPLAAQDAR